MSDSALRSLLALIHLSFRFDPDEGAWCSPDRTFRRAAVERAAGLSAQGTRQGLDELEDGGWVRTDRSGQAHEHRLLLDVPSRRFTYLPAALLERVAEFVSGSELRVVLAVLRGTWGWTHRSDAQAAGGDRIVHDRWVQLSNAALARKTGRTEQAAGAAAKAMQGRWIERVRPTGSAYQYRFLPEALASGPPDEAAQRDEVKGRSSEVSPRTGPAAAGSSSAGASSAGASSAGPSINEAHPKDFSSRRGPHTNTPPSRTRKRPPTSREESSASRQTHRQAHRQGERPRPSRRESGGPAADSVPAGNDQSGPSPRKSRAAGRKSDASPLEGLPSDQKKLAQKLVNAGLWASRARECVERYTARRVRANFRLFRKRASRGEVNRPGAWLYRAITDGYALPEAPGDASANDRSSPDLSHGDKLTAEERRERVLQGADPECFQRYRFASPDDPREFLYLAPDGR